MNPQLRLVHIDDDPFELDRVKGALERNAVGTSWLVESMDSAEIMRERIKQRPRPDVFIIDINMGDDRPSGIELAREVRDKLPSAVILICSNEDDVRTIGECLSAGADDFLSKKSDHAELALRVYNSWRLARTKQGNSPGSTDKATSASQAAQKAVGATMERVASRVPLIVGSAVTAVAVSGESGTGKEVVADLFRASLPRETPFVKVNCGAITPSLLESELFGHVKGAFTGAIADKRGLLEAATGGWIFLDEVATLSLSAQVALLSVLETQQVLRVGSTKPIGIAVRIISATNEPIEELIRLGKFRKDLWQRLRETEIALPPLRDRTGEIAPLVEHFCRTMPGGPYTATKPVLEVLSNLSWREGNIRELRNCLRAMTELHADKLLTPLALPDWVWTQSTDAASPGIATLNETGRGSVNSLTIDLAPATEIVFDDLSDRLLLELTRKLASAHGKLSLRGLARTINMSRSTLSGRFKAMLQKNLVSIGDLEKIVSVGEKSND